MEPPVPSAKPIQVQLDENVGQGVYSNLALIAHSPAEFVIDFARVLPGMPKAHVQARVIMTPQHIKSLAKALEDNIRKYEERYGEIKTAHPDKQPERNFGFQTE